MKSIAVLPDDLLWPGDRAADGARARRSLRRGSRRSADPTRVAIINCLSGGGRGLCVQSDRDVRPLAADDLASPQGPARGRSRRVVATRHRGPTTGSCPRRSPQLRGALRGMNVLFVCQTERRVAPRWRRRFTKRRGGNARSAGDDPGGARASGQSPSSDARSWRGSRARSKLRHRPTPSGPTSS